MKPSISKPALIAKLLDLHLTRTIDRLKAEIAMSKFKELASAIKGDMANFDKQADELFAEREEIRRLGEETFTRYREHHASVRDGINTMRQAVTDLSGSNSKNDDEKLEGSGVSSDKSFPVGEKG